MDNLKATSPSPEILMFLFPLHSPQPPSQATPLGAPPTRSTSHRTPYGRSPAFWYLPVPYSPRGCQYLDSFTLSPHQGHTYRSTLSKTLHLPQLHLSRSAAFTTATSTCHFTYSTAHPFLITGVLNTHTCTQLAMPYKRLCLSPSLSGLLFTSPTLAPDPCYFSKDSPVLMTASLLTPSDFTLLIITRTKTRPTPNMSAEAPATSDPLMELVNAFKAALRPTSTPPSASGCPMAMPAMFAGEAAECSGFLLQINLYIQMQPQQFLSENDKVAFLISLFTGKALQWAKAIWNSNNPIINSSEQFTDHFSEVFSTATNTLTTSDQLFRLHQGSSVNDYTLHFRTLTVASGWNEIVVLGAYQQGLNPENCVAMALYGDSIGLESFLQRTTRVSQRLATCQPPVTAPQPASVAACYPLEQFPPVGRVRTKLPPPRYHHLNTFPRVWDSAHHLQRAVCRHKSFTDAKRRAAPLCQPGDQVWLSTRDLRLPCRKLSPRYIGLFRILRQINEVTFQLQLPPRYRVHPTFHVSLLKAFSPSATDTPGAEAEPPSPEILDQPSIYTVHEILDSWRRGGCLEYLID
ncbi:Retrotransposon-like protein 1 [Labeo rohita]|uniref:Retrotransposon-like protein 1 n=1 Tax=Labeo rohita TaxID=84645 RepID=A0ABQ8M3G0_LABRO|nr:Retrotransposon-like protein 1 [Labeo rohita]